MPSDFTEGLPKSIALLSGYASKLAQDGLSLEDYDEIDSCLDELKGFVQSGREQLEKAYEDAGGQDGGDRKLKV
jgi:hypothetical protein